MKKVGFLSIASILMLLSSCEKLRYDLVPTRIEGKVVDILTGEPIPFAEITLWKSGDTYRIWKVASYQADAEGNFKIKHKFKYYKDDHPPINNYYISAKKDGYYKKINHSKYELKFDVNKEAIAQVEPTRANKNIVLKLIPICSLDLYVEDVPPYYQLQNNVTNELSLRFRPLETSTIGWKLYGYSVIGINNYITEFKIDTLTAGKYQLILFEENKYSPIVNVIDTFDVYLKPNQKNNVYLSY
jgi:hypothetical protein